MRHKNGCVGFALIRRMTAEGGSRGKPAARFNAAFNAAPQWSKKENEQIKRATLAYLGTRESPWCHLQV